MKKLTLSLVEEYLLQDKKFEIDENCYTKLESSFNFLESFSKNKIIYGINTGFGPMAQIRIEKEDLNNLQYNLIRSHSTGVGKSLKGVYAKSVVLARLNNFVQGNSGVNSVVVKQLQTFLNNDILPEIPEHGGVGASGDLVQLAHLGLNLIGEGQVTVDGKLMETKDAFKNLGIEPLKLKLRDGLGIINGTSCMTGISSLNLIYAKKLFNLALAASSILNEINDAYDDSFSKELNEVKLHKGQNEVAAQMRDFLSDSTLIRKRQELFNDNTALTTKKFKNKIQEYYSLRCIPQILGPVLDTLNYAQEVVENELNSTSDNPIINIEENNVFHGGNFHGDYVSLEMDKVKIVITKLTMLMERQLNYLLSDRLNKKFPPFLNAAKLGLNFGYQGLQFTATSTTAENQTLSNPMSIHSISNNNDNQDVVSMGTNSALMTKKVIENSFQVISIHIMAICQAIDLLTLEEKERLSSKTLKIYNLVRTKVDFLTSDRVMSGEISSVIELLKETAI
ncbi:MAG: aromatic amino acid lyase [Bacteroidetes bacterium]|nr:aromatic amino acid lyase [Bacteroidota bacterium]